MEARVYLLPNDRPPEVIGLALSKSEVNRSRRPVYKRIIAARSASFYHSAYRNWSICKYQFRVSVDSPIKLLPLVRKEQWFGRFVDVPVIDTVWCNW
jgi:hypothetical protein